MLRERSERRELLKPQVGVDETKYPLALARVSEEVNAKVAQLGALGHGGGVLDIWGQENLAAPTDGHHPSRAIHSRPEEVIAHPLGIAGMQTHPDSQPA